jgi:hypothetical protein
VDDRGLSTVPLDDDIGEEALGLGVVRSVLGHIVEGRLHARDLRRRSISGLEGGVEGGERRNFHSVSPRETMKGAVGASGFPLAVVRVDGEGAVSARGLYLTQEREAHRGRLAEHLETEGALGTPLRGQDESGLRGEVQRGNGDARTQPDLHGPTVARSGQGSKGGALDHRHKLATERAPCHDRALP